MEEVLEPKAKAKQLIRMFWLKKEWSKSSWNEAAEDAIICVENMISEFQQMDERLRIFQIRMTHFISYYEEVKKEIKNLSN